MSSWLIINENSQSLKAFPHHQAFYAGPISINRMLNSDGHLNCFKLKSKFQPLTSYLHSTPFPADDLLVEVFDELPLWSAPFGLKLLENVIYRKNIRAVDIGFGTGFPLIELAMRLGNSCKVYGIDPWEVAIRRAEKKIRVYGVSNIEIIRGVAEDMPIDNGSIDLVISNNGLNNVNDLNKALAECSRVMKSGGQFIQTMNLNDTMIEFYSAMEDVLSEFNMKEWIPNIQKHIYQKRKPLEEVIGLIEENGFVIEKVHRDRFDYKFTDGTSMLNHHAMRVGFMSSWKTIVPEKVQEKVFARVEQLLNKQAEKRGYFSLRVPFVVIDSRKK